MKKLLILISFLVTAALVAPAQNQLWHVAKGAKGVDSVAGAATVYYYLNSAASTGKTAATTAIKSWNVYTIQAGTVRSVITGTDSCTIELQVSLDNSNWVEYTATVPTVFGGGVYLYGDTRVTTTTDGGGVWKLSGIPWPYMRVKFVHYKAACNMYLQAWALMVPAQ